MFLAMSTRETLLPQDDPQGKKTRKPSNGTFKQQRMKAWEPTFTPKTALRFFLGVGTIFTLIGGFLVSANSKAKEIRLDYTQCHAISRYDALQPIPSDNIFTTLRDTSRDQPAQWKRSNRTITFDGVTKNYTLCTLELTISENLDPPVYFYYRLTNFYQNHRRYVKSFSKGQLKGDAVGLDSVRKSDCQPLAVSTVESLTQGDNNREKIIYPCGLIANSYFNDSFYDPQVLSLDMSDSTNSSTYPMSRTGIAPTTDMNPYGKTSYEVVAISNINDSRITPPPNWAERYPNGYHDAHIFNPTTDESFVVWMRTAGLPTFAKLAMRNDADVMKKGRYRLEIFSHFPSHDYGGTKSIIISTKSAVGGRSSFVGRSSVVLGGISMALATLFGITMLRRPGKLSDHMYLTPKEVPQPTSEHHIRRRIFHYN